MLLRPAISQSGTRPINRGRCSDCARCLSWRVTPWTPPARNAGRRHRLHGTECDTVACSSTVNISPRELPQLSGPRRPCDMSSLVADAGGTNTRVALAEGSVVLPGSVRRYRNPDHCDFTSLLGHYLETAGRVACSRACVAVAELTNVDWRIDTPGIAWATGTRTVALLNDLQAKGHALGYIAPSHLREIVPLSGTRSGAAQLVIVSAPASTLRWFIALLRDAMWLRPKPVTSTCPSATTQTCALHGSSRPETDLPMSRTSCRGAGSRIFTPGWSIPMTRPRACAPQTSCRHSPAATHAPKRLCVSSSVCSGCPPAAGNLALAALPFGGMYLVGGVSCAIAPSLQDLGFVEAFRDKGRFSGFMKSFGVSVIEDDYAAFAGCASHLTDCY